MALGAFSLWVAEFYMFDSAFELVVIQWRKIVLGGDSYVPNLLQLHPFSTPSFESAGVTLAISLGTIT